MRDGAVQLLAGGRGCAVSRPHATWAAAAEANDRRVIGRAEYPCGHGLRDGSPECPTCERLQLEADADEDARNAAAQADDSCACGELSTGADAAWDSGEHRCYRAGSLVESWQDTEHPRTGPSPAECIADQARAELQQLAEALNGPQAPIVDAVPFALQRQPVRESKRDADARVQGLPF